MVDFDAPTQPLTWIRPRVRWHRRPGMWLLPVLLLVFAAAALVDYTTARDEPTITATAPTMPTLVPSDPAQVTKAARLGYLAVAREKVPHRISDAVLLQWADAVCSYLDRRPTPMGLLTAMSALHNASELDGYRTAYVVGAAVQNICPRHSSLIHN